MDEPAAQPFFSTLEALERTAGMETSARVAGVVAQPTCSFQNMYWPHQETTTSRCLRECVWSAEGS